MNSAHVKKISEKLENNTSFKLIKVSDRTFLLHLGGKLEVNSKVPLRNRDDLSRAYTPGVARICLAIANDKSDVSRLTIKRNTVAVVTDGSAVLGLGNIGPEAALPVMEGKAALFKRFANVDAWPVCLDTQDVDEIVRTVQLIAPVYGGINLEDISAPRCFEIERKLKEILDIPVFHDDQHGTAVVVLAALINSLKIVDKKLQNCKIIISGIGAAGTAIARLLWLSGAKNIIGFDRKGVITRNSAANSSLRQWFIDISNPLQFQGSLSESMIGADIFIGVSAPNILSENDIKIMAPKSIVFALSNPDPEIDPMVARKHATIVATGRSDHPNQINNVLAFPGIFRGLLDSGKSKISDRLLLEVAFAIANCVKPEELTSDFIIPSVFNREVVESITQSILDTP